MVSSFVLWSMKIYDCVYLTAGIPNKQSLGSTLNRLVNCLDFFFFPQQLLGWDSTNCTKSECCSKFIYKIADKQICWSVQVSCCIQWSKHGLTCWPPEWKGVQGSVKQLLQEGNTGVLLKYRSRIIISQLSPNSLTLHLDFPFFLYL